MSYVVKEWMGDRVEGRRVGVGGTDGSMVGGGEKAVGVLEDGSQEGVVVARDECGKGESSPEREHSPCEGLGEKAKVAVCVYRDHLCSLIHG